MTCAVRGLIHETNTEVEFIPPGYTSVAQVMDAGLNKPFKDRICEEVDEFLVDTRFANVKPSRQTVAKWITNAWNQIPEQIIHNSWRHVGFAHPDLRGHPNPEELEHNDHHDPLALVEGDVPLADDDENSYTAPNDDASADF